MAERESAAESAVLSAVFDHSCKEALIAYITASLPYIDDKDMAELMKDTLDVLEAMTETEFSEIVFEPATDDEKSGKDIA